MLRILAKSKAPRLYIDIMMYKMMCRINEIHSSSDRGDYLNGKGMYQKQLQNLAEKEIGRIDSEYGISFNENKYGGLRDSLMQFAEYFEGKEDHVDWNKDSDVVLILDTFLAIDKHNFYE